MRKVLLTIFINLGFMMVNSLVWASQSNLLQMWQNGEYLTIINILESELHNNQYNQQKLADIYVYLSASYAELGRYTEARAYLSKASAIYREQGVWLKEAAALTDLAYVNFLLGKNKIALEQSESALLLLGEVQESSNLLIVSKVYMIKGKTQLSQNDYQGALESYQTLLALGEKLSDLNLQARAKLNLSEAHLRYYRFFLEEADYFRLEGFHQEAETNQQLATEELQMAIEFAEASYLLSKGEDNLLAVQIQLQLLTLFSAQGDIHRAVSQVKAIPDSAKKAELLLKLSDFSTNPKPILQSSLQVSSIIGDVRGQAKTLLAQSDLLVEEKNYSEAVVLIQKAIAQAGESLAEDVLYQGWFKLAKVNQILGNQESALLDYRRALGSLQSLRGTSSDSQIFQLDYEEEIEPIYRGYLNLLLANPTQSNLKEAIQVFELMQLSDLEDFFGDRCIEEIENNPAPEEILLETNSVALYAISTPSALHLLLLLPDGSLRHHSLKIDEEKLDEILKQWRYNLEDYATQRYLETSWWLYDSMFRPFASELASLNPSAIVFIGDRFFRNVPLDALHDGEQFLIEKYPLATTLGLQFSNFTENKGVKPSLILGLTVEKPPFDKLEFAQVEADRVAAILPKAKKLLDRDFTKERLTTELKKFTELSTLHLITHSNFAGTLEKSFLQTYDGKISLTELENFWINGEVAVNLVVLSACQTASGNSRSILGLAGVAVRGNAQAVIGSLWFINDEQASELMTYFYQNLYEGKVSKAVALQQAKIQLIKSSPDKQHPLFWSTLILVGNWL